MDTSKVIEAIGTAAAATKPAQEYCFLWSDWWPMCMTKSEWSGWMQAIGAIVAILASAMTVLYQLNADRKKNRRAAIAHINTFGGTLRAIPRKLSPNGNRSLWGIIQMRALLASELARADGIHLADLNFNEQQGVFAFRLAASVLLEALRLSEESTELSPDGQLVTEDAYKFLQHVIENSKGSIEDGERLLRNS